MDSEIIKNPPVSNEITHLQNTHVLGRKKIDTQNSTTSRSF